MLYIFQADVTDKREVKPVIAVNPLVKSSSSKHETQSCESHDTNKVT